MTYSLHRPPAGLSGFPRLIWPLVYLQLVALKAWMRQHYGPGMPYWYTVSRWGRVSLRHMPLDFAWSYAAPGALKPAAFDFTLSMASPRLAEAMSESDVAPVPLPERGPKIHSVYGLSDALHPDTS